jgi:hypothetical protein
VDKQPGLYNCLASLELPTSLRIYKYRFQPQELKVSDFKADYQQIRFFFCWFGTQSSLTQITGD